MEQRFIIVSEMEQRIRNDYDPDDVTEGGYLVSLLSTLNIVKPTVPEYVKEMLKTAEPESEVVVSKTCVSSSQPSLEVNEKPERSPLSILWEKVERPTIQFRSLTLSSFLSPSRAMRSKKQSSRFQVTPVVESETASFSGQFHSIDHDRVTLRSVNGEPR